MGPFTWLKKGGPTVILTPRTASEMRGKTVPQKVAKAAPTRIRLLKRKLLSRDSMESSSLSLLSRGRRSQRSQKLKTNRAPTKARKIAPISDCPKVCTEESTPLRVRK